MVKTTIVSSLCSVIKDLDLSITLEQLCKKVEALTGISPSDMKLTFEFEEGTVSRTIEDPERNPELQPFESIGHASRIIVEDSNDYSMVNQLQQLDEVDASFQLSEEAYAQRKDSVLNWKMQNKWGRFDPETKKKQDDDRNCQRQKADQLEVGQRCCVVNEGQRERRGWLRYVGKVSEISEEDIWCGVEFDSPVGKNDGTFKGRVYFGPVNHNHGGFVRPLNVRTGIQFAPFKEGDGSDEEI